MVINLNKLELYKSQKEKRLTELKERLKIPLITEEKKKVIVREITELNNWLDEDYLYFLVVKKKCEELRFPRRQKFILNYEVIKPGFILLYELLKNSLNPV